jgi:D-glycero-alpha-D-manno-heptose-7-phosphate kinase
MILVQCPVRISLIGGGSDRDEYLAVHKKGSVLSFTPNLYAYVSLNIDYIGRNSLNHKYVISYSRREEVDQPDQIQNELVREFVQCFNAPPVGLFLTSDIFAYGSGLAVSSAYSCALSMALNQISGGALHQIEIAKIAHYVEKKINPQLGYQDVYGCAVGGFKKISFDADTTPTYKFLPHKLFQTYTPYLIYTGINRNSTKVLETYKVPDSDSLNGLVDLAEGFLQSERYLDFFEIIKQGWLEKKLFTNEMLSDERLSQIDSELTNNPNCMAHKLCGAGSGGFFLAFFRADYKPGLEYKKIYISNEGVRRIL